MGRFNLYNILAAAAAARALAIPGRGHPERDRRSDPGSGTPGEGQHGGATRRFCRLRPHGRRPAAGPPESFRLPDGEDHHRLRVRRGSGPREEAAHGRGRDRLQRSDHRDLGQSADGGSPGDHPGDRNGHPGAEILRYRGIRTTSGAREATSSSPTGERPSPRPSVSPAPRTSFSSPGRAMRITRSSAAGSFPSTTG